MKKVFIAIMALFTICLSSCTKEALTDNNDTLYENQATEGDDGDIVTPPPPPPNP